MAKTDKPIISFPAAESVGMSTFAWRINKEWEKPQQEYFAVSRPAAMRKQVLNPAADLDRRARKPRMVTLARWTLMDKTLPGPCGWAELQGIKRGFFRTYLLLQIDRREFSEPQSFKAIGLLVSAIFIFFEADTIDVLSCDDALVTNFGLHLGIACNKIWSFRSEYLCDSEEIEPGTFTPDLRITKEQWWEHPDGRAMRTELAYLEKRRTRLEV